MIWQQSAHQRIGQIALKHQMLTSFDIVTILKQKRPEEKFGECANRLEYISDNDRLFLLLKQHYKHRLIGGYFVEKGIISSKEIILMVSKQKKHNSTKYRYG
jgi:hypothetical protein